MIEKIFFILMVLLQIPILPIFVGILYSQYKAAQSRRSILLLAAGILIVIHFVIVAILAGVYAFCLNLFLVGVQLLGSLINFTVSYKFTTVLLKTRGAKFVAIRFFFILLLSLALVQQVSLYGPGFNWFFIISVYYTLYFLAEYFWLKKNNKDTNFNLLQFMKAFSLFVLVLMLSLFALFFTLLSLDCGI